MFLVIIFVRVSCAFIRALVFLESTLRVLLPAKDPPTDDKQIRATKVTQRRNTRIVEQEKIKVCGIEVNVKSAIIRYWCFL